MPKPNDTFLPPSPPPRPPRVARVVQVTDCHLGPTDEYCLAGVRTYHSFREVVDAIGRDPDTPDLVIATGDIAAHGKLEAYDRFLRLVRGSALPWAWLPGNHDDFPLMLEGLPVSLYCPVVERGSWRLIALDTTRPGRVEGRLADSELAFLDQGLASEPECPVALFMHHPPRDVGCQWLDRQQVANGEALGELLSGHRQVKAIFSGHVHQNFQGDFHGIPFYATPSTCFQFTPRQREFAIDNRPPAYRWINFFDNGEFETDVVWISDTAEVVDPDVHGY